MRISGVDQRKPCRVAAAWIEDIRIENPRVERLAKSEIENGEVEALAKRPVSRKSDAVWT